MFKSALIGIRSLYFFNIFVAFSFPLLGFVEWTLNTVWLTIGMYVLFDCFGIVLTYHRYHAHRGFEFRWKWMEWLFTLFGMLAGAGSPLGWVAIHRDHHKYSDTEKDPHSPVHGIWRVFTIDYPYERNKWSVRSLVVKREQRLFHEYYFLILAAYVSLLFLVFGVPGVYFGFCVPGALILFAQGLTNYVNHKTWAGYTNFEYDDDSRNVWWMAPFNFGEGWHQNHHVNPRQYNARVNWWEIDIAGEIAELVKK